MPKRKPKVLTAACDTATVLRAVQAHPKMMSPILLEYLLRGDRVGRMVEKGLTDSPHHGAAADAAPGEVADTIAACLTNGWLARVSGFYPALRLTPAGEAVLGGAL